MMANNLKGLTVVNTRPVHQAVPLSDLVRKAGGEPIEFPAIEIVPPIDSTIPQSQLKKAHEADIAIFISANAVDSAMQLLGGAEFWPENTIIASVGQATATRIEAFGLDANLVSPEPFNSDALLSLLELQNLAGKKVLIIRGNGGRELLGNSLQTRGAKVEYVECYRRIAPEADPTLLYQSWEENRKLVIVVTSNEGLRNLCEMVDSEHQQKLLSTLLFVVSERTMNLALELGFKQTPLVASKASNEGIVDTIQHWQSNH